jgi:choline-sulfatase
MPPSRSGVFSIFAVLAGVVAVALVASKTDTLRRTRSSAPDASIERASEPDAPDAAEAVARELPPAPRTFNVLMITIDTLRWDLGFMGYPRPITPNLDALADRSTVFERAYATASYTPKSIGPLLIGRYASETFRDPEHYTTFYPANVFVAERLRDAGHRTLAAMCHHYFKWKTLLDQGFEVWDTSTAPAIARDDDPSVTGDKLTDVAISLLGEERNAEPNGGRFFAWFHYMDPHTPYVAHDDAPDLVAAAPDAGPPARGLYDQEVWFTDKHVGRLLSFVAAQPWASETAIIVTADHGEAFGERGFWRHGRELWESLVRVPLLLYVPGAPPKRVRDAKRSHVDVVPTILELMGVPSTSGPALRGTSLVRDVTADASAPVLDRDVYLDMPAGPFNEARRAIIIGTPGSKLVDFGGERYELYDLATDPLETRAIGGDAGRLRSAIQQLRRFRAGLEEVPAAR